ncbi:MAG: hypothetical protein HGA85_07650 [Nanoarchaeota archaeon]|nr:hypothetical protein [Nanoarchaeota archaeon]
MNNTATITSGAITKAYLYASLTEQVFPFPVELNGYLLSPKHMNDRVIRDVHLVPALVGPGHYLFHPTDISNEAEKVYRQGNNILGIWHSHARLSTFHSHDDNIVLEDVFELFAFDNKIKEKRIVPNPPGPFSISTYSGNIWKITDKASGLNAIIESPTIGSVSFALGHLYGIKEVKETYISEVYSLVVNADGEKPHLEIMSGEFNNREGNFFSIEKRRGNLKIIEEGLQFDKKDMLEEITQKVSLDIEGFI